MSEKGLFSQEARAEQVNLRKRTMYQHKVDVHMLNTVKSVLADILSV